MGAKVQWWMQFILTAVASAVLTLLTAAFAFGQMKAGYENRLHNIEVYGSPPVTELRHDIQRIDRNLIRIGGKMGIVLEGPQ